MSSFFIIFFSFLRNSQPLQLKNDIKIKIFLYPKRQNLGV